MLVWEVPYQCCRYVILDKRRYDTYIPSRRRLNLWLELIHIIHMYVCIIKNMLVHTLFRPILLRMYVHIHDARWTLATHAARSTDENTIHR